MADDSGYVKTHRPTGWTGHSYREQSAYEVEGHFAEELDSRPKLRDIDYPTGAHLGTRVVVEPEPARPVNGFTPLAPSL